MVVHNANAKAAALHWHGSNPAPRRDQGGSYEIGSWEKPDYAQQGEKPKTDKQVVIRYKEKRRIVTK